VHRRTAVSVCLALLPFACGGTPVTEERPHEQSPAESVATQVAPLTIAAATVITNAADNLRTGWYPDQAALAPDTVAGSNFGQLFSTALNGQIYAQPLVSGGTVFVVTETDNVYALDASTGAIQASLTLPGTPFNPADVGCSDILPAIGITGTPVIDSSTNTAYFFAKTYASGSSGPAVWSAHALDVNTLQERTGFPVAVVGAAANDPTSVFEAAHQHQRTGVLLMNGVLYAGFGSHCDAPPYRGWVAAVTTTGQLKTLWTSEVGAASSEGGIWGGGAGLVSDGAGQILFATGNGTSSLTPAPGNQVPGALAEAVVRLSVQADGSLLPADYFMAEDADYLNSKDIDLGSGGPLALPDSFGTTSVPHLLVEVGKEGYLYLLDRDRLGGFRQGPGGTDLVVERLGPNGGLWGKPSAWPGDGGYVYYQTNGGPLRAYAAGVDGIGNPSLSLAGATTDTFGYTSGSVVVTSNGTTSGTALVWVEYTTGPSGANAELRAYDAVPLGETMNLRFRAPLGHSSKFAMPGVAGGRVYVGTRDGNVIAFGSPTSAPLQTGPLAFGTVVIGQSATLPFTLTASSPVTITALSTTDPEFTVGPTVPALPAILNVGDTLTTSVTFAPATAGLHEASFDAATSVGTQPFQMTGTAETAQASLAVTPGTLSLGATTIGQTLEASVTIQNQGAQPLTINAISPPAPPFTVSGLPGAGAVLGAGQSVTATVTFTPAGIGSFNGTLSLATSAGNASVALSGSAAAAGDLVIAPAHASAGNVTVNGSALASFTLINAGATVITVTKSKAPANAAFKVVSDIPEGTQIVPGGAATATVRFSPTTVGFVQDAWVLNADDSGGVRSVAIDGNGVAGIPAPSAGGWTLNGNSSLSGSTLVLTTAAGGQRGSAFWPTAVSSQNLTINFDAAIDSGNGADGLTLTFASPSGGAAPTSLGAGGGGLGFSGIPGIAVALDTYKNAVNPSANFVGISDGAGSAADVLHWIATATNVPPLRGVTRHVTATLAGGLLTVAIDGVTYLSSVVTLPPSVLVGFTGGCGGLTDRHAVSNVSISTAPITNASAKWQINGSAIATATGFQLTDTGQSEAGSVFWTDALASSAITVELDSSIGSGSGADGLTIAFANPAAGAGALGVPGGGLGFSGISGVAVALDTWKNAVNPSANFIGITTGPANGQDLLSWLATATTVPPLRGTPHHIVVTLQGGTLSVTIDGTAAVSAPVTLPPAVLVGFTAGSGGATDIHAVNGVHVTGLPVP
jgi:hypothetical protein